MGKNIQNFLLSLSLLLLLLPFSSAEIKNIKITTDSRGLILFEKFGFTHTGHITVNVSDVSYYSSLSLLDSSRFGFILISEDALNQVILESQNNPNFCILDSLYIFHLFSFKDLSLPQKASFNHSYPVLVPNQYSLFFANCEPKCQVSMTVHTETYNTGNAVKDYLPAGQTQLPIFYFFFSLPYFTFLGFWIYVCYANKPLLRRIHVLMAGLLLVKTLNLICAAEAKHYIKVTGTPHGWDVLFYIFHFLSVVLFFTVIVLIGTGWSFMKTFLQEREKIVLMIVIVLQVVANLASVVIGEKGPFIKDWVTWNQVFLLVDVLCCCTIIFPIQWSIRSLREKSNTDGKVGRNLAKLTLFWWFYIVVIGYLCFTRIVMFALRTIVAYKFVWVNIAAYETAILAFYLVIFYMFRPIKMNEYFVHDEGDMEALEEAHWDEEFER